MISVEVRAQQAQTRLRQLARDLGDRRAANAGVAAKLAALVFRNFQEESHDGEPWAPLAPSTERAKERLGYDKILQNTGALRQ